MSFLGWVTHDQIYHIYRHRLGTCLVPGKAPLASLGMSNEIVDMIANLAHLSQQEKFSCMEIEVN